jgi:hypothetical protein
MTTFILSFEDWISFLHSFLIYLKKLYHLVIQQQMRELPNLMNYPKIYLELNVKVKLTLYLSKYHPIKKYLLLN